MAEQLVDLPDRQLFGDSEFHLRDAAREFATTVHRTALQERKKGGTAAPA